MADGLKWILRGQQSVYCKIKLPKVAKQNWTKLQVQIGQSCKALYQGPQERCCALVVAIKYEPVKRSIADISKNH